MAHRTRIAGVNAVTGACLTAMHRPSNSAKTIRPDRAAIEALIKEAGPQLWIEHDIQGYGPLKKSPAFYE